MMVKLNKKYHYKMDQINNYRRTALKHKGNTTTGKDAGETNI